jgi:hypothetical protein
VSEHRDYTSLYFALEGTTYGTGQIAANGGGFYRTAWQAPQTGQYRLTVDYWGFGGYGYAPQDNDSRDVSITFESNLAVLDSRASGVLHERTHPDLRDKNAQMATEVAERLLEFIAGRLISIYLGVIGSFIAKQVLSWVFDLTPRSSRSGQFSIDRYEPRQLSLDFHAVEGETYLFQFTPSVGWSAQSYTDYIMTVDADAKYYVEALSITPN